MTGTVTAPDVTAPDVTASDVAARIELRVAT
jgi:hypothetical protein